MKQNIPIKKDFTVIPALRDDKTGNYYLNWTCKEEIGTCFINMPQTKWQIFKQKLKNLFRKPQKMDCPTEY